MKQPSKSEEPVMVGRPPHPGPLPIGSADSADAEREKRSQPSDESTMVSGSTGFQQSISNQRLFPLPEGEGQGEGERVSFPSMFNISLWLPRFALAVSVFLIVITG